MRGVLRHPLRVAGRLGAFLAVNTAGVLEHRWRLRRSGLGDDPRACSQWLQRWSRQTLVRLGMAWGHHGELPVHGMVVCNHLGYLDIPILAATTPMVFVSKAEVAGWPFLGTLARCGGTLFLKREQRGHVAEIASAVGPIIEAGTVVTLFPEGTSSGGESVLPFRSSLLEPAAAGDWPVTPAWISYEVTDGRVADEVAYWRDMTFAPHFLNLLSQRRIVGRVRYGSAIRGIRDRKELTRRLQEAVELLRAEGCRAG